MAEREGEVAEMFDGHTDYPWVLVLISKENGSIHPGFQNLKDFAYCYLKAGLFI